MKHKIHKFSREELILPSLHHLRHNIDILKTNKDKLEYLLTLRRELERVVNCFLNYDSFNIGKYKTVKHLKSRNCPEMIDWIDDMLEFHNERRIKENSSFMNMFNKPLYYALDNIYTRQKLKLISIHLKEYLVIVDGEISYLQSMENLINEETVEPTQTDNINNIGKMLKEILRLDSNLLARKTSKSIEDSIKHKLIWFGTEKELDDLLHLWQKENLINKNDNLNLYKANFVDKDYNPYSSETPIKIQWIGFNTELAYTLGLLFSGSPKLLSDEMIWSKSEHLFLDKNNQPIKNLSVAYQSTPKRFDYLNRLFKKINK